MHSVNGGRRMNTTIEYLNLKIEEIKKELNSLEEQKNEMELELIKSDEKITQLEENIDEAQNVFLVRASSKNFSQREITLIKENKKEIEEDIKLLEMKKEKAVSEKNNLEQLLANFDDKEKKDDKSELYEEYIFWTLEKENKEKSNGLRKIVYDIAHNRELNRRCKINYHIDIKNKGFTEKEVMTLSKIIDIVIEVFVYKLKATSLQINVIDKNEEKYVECMSKTEKLESIKDETIKTEIKKEFRMIRALSKLIDYEEIFKEDDVTRIRIARINEALVVY